MTGPRPELVMRAQHNTYYTYRRKDPHWITIRVWLAEPAKPVQAHAYASIPAARDEYLMSKAQATLGRRRKVLKMVEMLPMCGEPLCPAHCSIAGK